MATPVFNLPAVLANQPVPSLSIPGFIQQLRSSGITKDSQLADSLDSLQQYADSISRILGTIISQLKIAAVASAPLIVFEEEISLPSGPGTTAIVLATPPTVNALLLVIVKENSTGGRQITWPSTVKWATVEIDTTPSTDSLFALIGRLDPVDSVIRWFGLTPAVVTGQTP